MRNIYQWISAKISGETRDGGSACSQTPSPPTLPSQRRPITPSLTENNQFPDTSLATAQSPIYTRLPGELRDKILVHAFGNRTMHIDLRYSGPDPRTTAPNNHAGIDCVEAQGEYTRCSQPKKWRWWGSVCHRSAYEEPWQDLCRNGRAACFLHGGDDIRECMVGCMGFMLSCRQAYIDTTRILYSTNIFYMHGAPLLHDIAGLIPLQHLRRMTSLQVQFHLNNDMSSLIPSEGGQAMSEVLVTLCRNLSTHFTSLNRLYLSLHSPPRASSGAIAESTQHSLDAAVAIIDDMVSDIWSRGGRLITLELAVPTSIYSVREREAKERKDIVEATRGWPRCNRFWRQVVLDQDRVGYWVRRGVDDTTLMSGGM